MPHAETADDELHLDPSAYQALVDTALAEDHAREDVTGIALLSDDLAVVADVIAKQNGVVAGLPIVPLVFQRLDARCEVETEYEDGDRIGEKSRLLTIRGPARAVLAGERVALNFLGHLSGIASLTAAYVEHTMATGCRSTTRARRRRDGACSRSTPCAAAAVTTTACISKTPR